GCHQGHENGHHPRAHAYSHLAAEARHLGMSITVQPPDQKGALTPLARARSPAPQTMKLRCSKCRQAWIDVSVGRCDACGLMLGEHADIVVPSALGTLDSTSAEDVELDAEMA